MSLKENIERLLEYNNETWKNVEDISAGLNLDEEFDDTSCAPFCVWSKELIVFSVIYDGIIGISSVFRNPNNGRMFHVDGGG